jgi:eukaryotic-like serine/threonine-protein kinase
MSSVPPGSEDVDLSGLDDFDDDGEMGRTSVGTDLFGTQEVPQYPAVARLGQFEILGRIARGGMAEVYLARERADDGSVRHVVVKRVLTEMQHDAAMLGMFLDEGRIALRLFHPNVCHVYECGEANGLTFMALEWVHGTSLREVIRRAGPRGGLPVPVAVHVIAKIAGALEYVHHAKGIDGRPLSIVHQDVTPHNVMLSWKGQVKLLDFGIAKTSAEAEHGTAVPQGKFEYMSPEQVRGEPIDARSDIFALGVCLYEALTSRA